RRGPAGRREGPKGRGAGWRPAATVGVEGCGGPAERRHRRVPARQGAGRARGSTAQPTHDGTQRPRGKGQVEGPITVTRTALILFAALALLASAGALRAQGDDVTATAHISSTTVYIGDTVRYTISVEGDGAADPEQPTVTAPGFDVQAGGRSESVQIINGR